jgi:hypothetical protein
MSIVPAGKVRIMVAQNFSTPSMEGFDDMGINGRERDLSQPLQEDNSFMDYNPLEEKNNLDTESAMDDDLGSETIDDDINDVNIEEGEEQELAPKENRKTLTSYIFEKLQSYGYPGRRLQDFKSEFVKESVSPEGQKDIEVVIPDKKYPDEQGYTDTIENEELKDIAHEINQSFGLNFNGADRAGGKWTIKFTSADISSGEEEVVTRDSLDQVYGKADKGGSSSLSQPSSRKNKPGLRTPSEASSIHEMIKASKDDIINKIRKINGE